MKPSEDFLYSINQNRNIKILRFLQKTKNNNNKKCNRMINSLLKAIQIKYYLTKMVTSEYIIKNTLDTFAG